MANVYNKIVGRVFCFRAEGVCFWIAFVGRRDRFGKRGVVLGLIERN